MPRLERAFVSWRRWRARTITKIWRIQIVLAGDADQGEQGITPGIGQCSSHPVRLAISAMEQTGQWEAIHSPEEWASKVVRFSIREA